MAPLMKRGRPRTLGHSFGENSQLRVSDVSVYSLSFSILVRWRSSISKVLRACVSMAACHPWKSWSRSAMASQGPVGSHPSLARGLS
eukprot:2501503-Pyramimonas_sp.AAC.1